MLENFVVNLSIVADTVPIIHFSNSKEKNREHTRVGACRRYNKPNSLSIKPRCLQIRRSWRLTRWIPQRDELISAQA
ncbi:MAG: hypothetical protein ACLTBD_05340 [Clostridia bacterium]